MEICLRNFIISFLTGMNPKGLRLHLTIGSLKVIGLLLIGGILVFGLRQSHGISNSPYESGTIANPKSTSELVTEWGQAVQRHDSGEADPSAVLIATWPERDLETVIRYVTKLSTQSISDSKRVVAKRQIQRLLSLTDREVQQGDFSRILKLGALLHTDIALLELKSGATSRTSSAIRAFVDGHVLDLGRNLHWEYARRLVNAIAPNPSKVSAVRQWYIATTAYMQYRRLLAYAGQNLKQALEIFPSDDQILFYAGVLHETWAAPVNQNVQLSPGIQLSYGSRESELKLAEQYFRKAIAVNPAYSEAHLRYGRVLGLLGRHGQSLTELEQAAAQITNPQLEYYNCLYLGYELAMLSRPEEARNQYEHAAMLFPNAQSPLLALSQLERSQDKEKDAWSSVQRVFALDLKDFWKDDPWWTYDLAHVQDAPALINQMRKMLGEHP